MGRFKIFDTIDRYIKLYEADEQEMSGEGAPEGQEGAPDATAPQQMPEQQMPEEPQVPHEDDTTISPTTKLDWARIMLAALGTSPDEIQNIPKELQVATEQNADAVIDKIRQLVNLEDATSEQQLVNALNN